MAKVFISYAHVSPDQELAQQLSRYLETNQFSVFVDSKIRLGQDWVEQIDRQLRASQYFVALLSSKSVGSDMVRREIALAYKLRKTKSLTILPVRLGFEDELPYEIGAYLDLIQYVVWRPGEPFEPICRTVLQVMTEPTVLKAATTPARVLSSSGIPSHPGENIHHFGAAELDGLKQTLAEYVGPVARIMVDRASKKAADWKQLYEILASEVPVEHRKKFLMSRPR